MFEKMKSQILEAEKLITSEINAEKETRNEYLDSCNVRRSSIDNKIKEKQDELAIIQAESELLPQRMADALDTGDPETALEIEKKITESSAKITELERSIELLSKAIPKGDPELFANAIEAHKVKRQKVKAVLMELKSIESQIINIHKELMEVQEVLQPKLKSTLNILSSHHPDESLIQMYEEFSGPIDVTGHTAFSDENAKMRFLNGISAGIEATPAGKKLRKEGTKNAR